jgi:hypothetical protein
LTFTWAGSVAWTFTTTSEGWFWGVVPMDAQLATNSAEKAISKILLYMINPPTYVFFYLNNIGI